MIKYLHTMIRVKNLDESLTFYCDALGLHEARRKDYPENKFTLIYLSCDTGHSELELTYNWESKEELVCGRSFGHLAYEVDDIYQICEELKSKGIVINRPPRDGRMAFIKSPDGVSIEFLQKGMGLDIKQPWVSMPNIGEW